MVLDGHVKQCDVKQCNKCDYYLKGGGGICNVFGDRPNKWSIAKNNNNNQKMHPQVTTN
jgi:hypothetical protein